MNTECEGCETYSVLYQDVFGVLREVSGFISYWSAQEWLSDHRIELGGDTVDNGFIIRNKPEGNK